MRIWTIIEADYEIEIQVSSKTLLYGHDYRWTLLARRVEDFFNNRNSDVQILMDGVPLDRKDWECYYIPLDIHVELEKVTTRSPLKGIQQTALEQIISSPLYSELLELWEELGEELQFLNQKLESWGILANLTNISERELIKHINFSPKDSSSLAPIKLKRLMLNLIFEKELNKRTLIILELPELLANKSELVQLKHMIEQSVQYGYEFIIVSKEKNFGLSKNYWYRDKVIHEALFERMREKVCSQLPFYCSPELYEEAKNQFINLVDNSIDEDLLWQKVFEHSSALFTILYVFMYNLNIVPAYVPKGLEPNLKQFISALI